MKFIVGFFRLIEDLVNCLIPIDIPAPPTDWTDGNP